MACFAVFAFSACSLNKSGAPDSKGKEPLKIICTNFASYDFVRQIVGDKAEVTMLLKPGAEAHSYEPSPKDIQAIGKSDLFVYTGGDSDEWVDGILNSMDKSKLKTLKMMDTVKLYEEEMSEGMQEEEHEHHHDDKDHHEEDKDHHLFLPIFKENKNIKEPLCFTLRVPSPLPLSYNRLQILTDKSHRLHQTIFLIFFDKHIFI